MTPPETPQSPESAAGNLRLLRLLGEISSNFVSCHPDRIDAVIEESQQLIVETLGLDRSTLWQITDERNDLHLTHCWQKPEWPPLPAHLLASSIVPWSRERVLAGEMFHFNSLDDLPADACVDVASFRVHGPKSNVTIPLVADGRVFGALAFASLAREKRWNRDEIGGLELISRVVGNVIGRQRAEQRAEQLHRELARSSRASTLGELAAALAHEINQPLSSILSNAQAARRFIAAGEIDSTEILTILDDIIRDSKRAGGVIRSLRSLLEGSPTSRESFRLDEIIAEACGFLAAGLARENIRIEHHPAEVPLQVHAARVEIHEVLVNLVINASQAMTGTAPEQRTIRIETSGRGREALIEISDHGCGFPHGESDRLFQPFHTTKPDGLGMGLAICRRIVQAHGGSIRARSRDGGGAVFSFSLPLHTAAPDPG